MAKKNDYTIATRLTLSGEKEFNNAMKEAAERTKNLNADLEKAKAKFEAGGSETEYLTEKLEILGKQLENKKSQLADMNAQLEHMREKSAQAQQRVSDLEKQLALTPQGTAEWKKLSDQLVTAKQSALRASTDLKKLEAATTKTETSAYQLQKEINETTEALENVGEESEDTGRKLEQNLGDAAEEAQSKFAKMAKSIQADLGDIKKMKKLTIAIDLARGAWDTAGQIYNYVQDATKEGMREAISDYNIEQSGGDTAQAQKQRAEYAAIFGDTDSAREAAANLAALNLGAEEYEKAAKAIGGAALKFQDTLKVEGLADSLQESLSTGALTGPIAEFFERMESQTGLSLETINSGLAEAKAAEEAGDEGAVQKVLLNYLEASGIGDYYESFKQQNESLIETAEATQSIEETIRDISTELATTVAPLLRVTTENILPPIAETVRRIAQLVSGEAFKNNGYTDEDATRDAEAIKNEYKAIYGAEQGIEEYNKMLAEQAKEAGQDAEEYREAVRTPEGAAKYIAESETVIDKLKVAIDYLTGRTLDLFGMASAGGEELSAVNTQPKTRSELEQDRLLLIATGQTNTQAFAQTEFQLANTVITQDDMQDMTDALTGLAEEGEETGKGFVQNMLDGMNAESQAVADAQQNMWNTINDIWQRTIEGQVVVSYKTGPTVGPVNQSLTIEPQTVKVELDGKTLINELIDPINIMLNKKIK